MRWLFGHFKEAAYGFQQFAFFIILVPYTGGILIGRFKQAEKKKAAKAALIVSSVLSLSLLAFFKYADFAIGTVSSLSGAGIAMLNIALPIGISFYTFQTISYTIDVYRGEAAVQKNLISFGTYSSMFTVCFSSCWVGIYLCLTIWDEGWNF